MDSTNEPAILQLDNEKEPEVKLIRKRYENDHIFQKLFIYLKCAKTPKWNT